MEYTIGIQHSGQFPSTANRYAALSNLNEPESVLAVYHQSNGKFKKKKFNTNKPRHNVFIIGDSHARGIAVKLQHNLEKDYSVTGLVKPGADLSAILSSGVKDIKDFTKNDVVVLWGGTKDVSRNETSNGQTQIRNFVRENGHTNILVMNLPDRQDLEVNSCVNREIKVFNRKLCKYMKPFDYAFSLEVIFEREHYTRHGLHLNTKGKDLSATKILCAIKDTFKKVR